MDSILPVELVEAIFIQLLATDPACYWILVRLTRWSLRLAIRHMREYRVKDIHLEKILPRLARYMPNLEQLTVVPLKSYFHAHLSVAALYTLQKFSRLTYLDIGYAYAPNTAAILTMLTQLQCIESARDVTTTALAHLTINNDSLIRKLPPLTSLAKVRRVTLTQNDTLNLTELFTEPLTRVTCLTVQGRQTYSGIAKIFPNLESIQLHVSPSGLQVFTEFKHLTSLEMRLPRDCPPSVNLSPLTRLERLKLDSSGKHREFIVSSQLTRVTLMGEDSTASWKFTALQRLTLNYVPIYSARELRALTQLQHLTFKRCIALEAKSLQWLAVLPCLTHLTWQGVSDAGLEALTACSSLTSLQLMHGTASGTRVNQLHQLRRLVLCNVVLEGDYLSQLYRLEQLVLVSDRNDQPPLDLQTLQSACDHALTALVIHRPRAHIDGHISRALHQLTQLKYLHIQQSE
eukprot:TRINITY_DN10292_c0_g1_i1.p1 TRINITY_DN10292_c0_g1~~TRINITY_DN10292_c0_g1_i1.p1  ORF type:complete len:460 (+),score=107.81 TRINITY_DN10292_c0_g1_i1:21-1400(+)